MSSHVDRLTLPGDQRHTRFSARDQNRLRANGAVQLRPGRGYIPLVCEWAPSHLGQLVPIWSYQSCSLVNRKIGSLGIDDDGFSKLSGSIN